MKPYYADDRATLYGGAHFQAVMARQRHERVGWGGVWACSTCLTEAVAS